MTDIERSQIMQRRRAGQSYASIAKELNVSINSVKSFCRRNANNQDSADNSDKPKGICENCGKRLKQLPHRKRKRFCCDKCRNKWWNAHLDLVKRKAVYHMKCQNCERDFDVYGNAHRKYCSHRCYIEYRFGGIGNDEKTV